MKITEILKQIDLEPSKLRGQNFLTDNNIIEKIIKTAEIKKTDNILEIGPGLGVLTKLLSAKAKKVLAIEKDRRLFDYLQNQIGKNVKIVNADALKFDFNIAREYFNNEDYQIVANLPYNITSGFFRLFLETDYPATNMTVMIQREVAERIVERDGKSSILSLSVKFFADAKIAFHVSPGCFFPAPKVESSVIVLTMKQGTRSKEQGTKEQMNKRTKNNNQLKLPTHHKPRTTCDLLLKTNYFKFIKEAFSSKRKQMLGNLKSFPKDEVKEILLQLGYDEKVRAEDVEFADFVELVEFFNNKREKNNDYLYLPCM